MQESGRIQVLYNKWWKNTGMCVSDDKKKESKASSLGVANVGGIFVVLFVGLALAVIVAGFEFVWNNRRQTSVNRLNKQVIHCLLSPRAASTLSCPVVSNGYTSKYSAPY